MADYKKRIKAALENHHRELAKPPKPPSARRKNGKPEQVVVKEILAWSKSRGLDLHVVESKAVYHSGAGRYLYSMTSESLPDLIGNYRGLSVWIEAKALGRASTLKEHQRSFLYRKANHGCFATCADSVKMLEERFEAFIRLPENDRSTYLLQFLQEKRSNKDETDLF